MLVVLDSIMSTVESQGTSHSAGSNQMMFIGKGRERVSGPPAVVKAKCYATKILMYSITVRVCS